MPAQCMILLDLLPTFFPMVWVKPYLLNFLQVLANDGRGRVEKHTTKHTALETGPKFTDKGKTQHKAAGENRRPMFSSSLALKITCTFTITSKAHKSRPCREATNMEEIQQQLSIPPQPYRI